MWSSFSFAACWEIRRFSYKSRMGTLMRSTLLIFYENAAALLNFLNLGFSEPEAVQFNFSLLGFSSLPLSLSPSLPLSVPLSPSLFLSLSPSLSKEEMSLTLNSCVCHLLFHPLFEAKSHCFFFFSSSLTVRQRRLPRSVFHARFRANLGSAGFGQSKGNGEHRRAGQWDEVLYAGGEFKRRNLSPCQDGRWHQQHGGFLSIWD